VLTGKGGSPSKRRLRSLRTTVRNNQVFLWHRRCNPRSPARLCTNMTTRFALFLEKQCNSSSVPVRYYVTRTGSIIVRRSILPTQHSFVFVLMSVWLTTVRKSGIIAHCSAVSHLLTPILVNIVKVPTSFSAAATKKQDSLSNNCNSNKDPTSARKANPTSRKT
jgi:hypothetical protein